MSKEGWKVFTFPNKHMCLSYKYEGVCEYCLPNSLQIQFNIWCLRSQNCLTQSINEREFIFYLSGSIYRWISLVCANNKTKISFHRWSLITCHLSSLSAHPVFWAPELPYEKINHKQHFLSSFLWTLTDSDLQEELPAGKTDSRL